MNTKEIRKKLQLTQKEFADEYKIPIGTVKNWDSRDCMPNYVHLLFEKIIKADEEYQELEQRYLKSKLGIK